LVVPGSQVLGCSPLSAPADRHDPTGALDVGCAGALDPLARVRSTVNLRFYLGVDARGAARADEVAMVDQFRALGCTRLSIPLRNRPYDGEAFAAVVRRG